MRSVFVLALAVPFFACSPASTEPVGVAPGSDGGAEAATDSSPSPEDGGFNTDAAPMDAPPEVVAKVYANTDTTLWQLEPLTKVASKIGNFTGLAMGEDMTDIAVNEAGDIYGVSTVPSAEGHVYQLTLPLTGAGAVTTTVKRNILASVKFFALAFAPKGVLDPDEVLVAGDNQGTLWQVPTGGAMPTKIGDFGRVNSGDPGGGNAGDSWQLSGDLVFFSNKGSPIGLATVRACSSLTNCVQNNDVVVEIDMTKLALKTATTNVKKRFLGATGHARLFGVGAWDNSLFGFQRANSTTKAQLIEVSLDTGKATVLRDFPEVSDAGNGWSGAGVTTAAKISVPK